MVRDAGILLPLLAAGTALSVQSAPLSQFLLGTDGNRWLFPMTLVNGLIGAALTYGMAARLGIESVGWATILSLAVGRVPLQILAIKSAGDRALDTAHFLFASYSVSAVTVLLRLGAWAATKWSTGGLPEPLQLRIALVVAGATLSAVVAFVVAHGRDIARQDFHRILRLGRLLTGRVAIPPATGSEV